MRIPADFKLFSQQWRVRGAQPGEIGTDLGQCRPDQLEVILNPNQTAESLLMTFWHEVIHAIETRLELAMTERQVDLIALGIIDLMRNNPVMLESFGVESATRGAEDAQ